MFRNIIVMFAALILLICGGAEAEKKSADFEGDRVISLKYDTRVKPGKKMLIKKKAKDYIGDLKEKVAKGGYSAEILLRNSRSVKHDQLSDGIIFNTNNGKLGYADRTDGFYRIIVDSPHGRVTEEVTALNFTKFEAVINDENPIPYVLFDKDGNEAAIVYLPKFVWLKQKFNRDKDVVIELKEAP